MDKSEHTDNAIGEKNVNKEGIQVLHVMNNREHTVKYRLVFLNISVLHLHYLKRLY